MEKMMSLTLFDVTPAFGPYVPGKDVSAGLFEYDLAGVVVCKSLAGCMKTDLVEIR